MAKTEDRPEMPPPHVRKVAKLLSEVSGLSMALARGKVKVPKRELIIPPEFVATLKADYVTAVAQLKALTDKLPDSYDG